MRSVSSHVPHPVGVSTHDALADMLHVQLSLEMEECRDDVRVSVQVRNAALIPLTISELELLFDIRISIISIRSFCPPFDESVKIGAVRVSVRVGGKYLSHPGWVGLDSTGIRRGGGGEMACDDMV